MVFTSSVFGTPCAAVNPLARRAQPKPYKGCVVCSSSKNHEDQRPCNRRSLMSGLGVGLLVASAFDSTSVANAAGFGSYMKKKMLDPLDTYVAPLLAARDELVYSCAVAETDVLEARSMLRSGALSGFRVNARAVGEYAERLETSSDGKKLVDTAIGKLEKYDSVLLQLSRDQTPDKQPKELLEESLSAIDALIGTVPADVMKDVRG
ncbi:hypothetical protein BSKO_00528 [Bryopsis sp. KO-2023]|nr:hypothetical protein BSKO_00528 [Bryopsis sp. KO-2023]